MSAGAAESILFFVADEDSCAQGAKRPSEEATVKRGQPTPGDFYAALTGGPVHAAPRTYSTVLDYAEARPRQPSQDPANRRLCTIVSYMSASPLIAVPLLIAWFAWDTSQAKSRNGWDDIAISVMAIGFLSCVAPLFSCVSILTGWATLHYAGSSLGSREKIVVWIPIGIAMAWLAAWVCFMGANAWHRLH